MKKIWTLLLLNFLISSWELHAAAAEPMGEDIDYGRLETVVRLKTFEGRGSVTGSADYKGLSLMFETRPSDTTHYIYCKENGCDIGYVWAAEVRFRPRAVLGVGGNSGSASLMGSKYSQMHVRYITTKDYFSSQRRYGHIDEFTASPSSTGSDKIDIKSHDSYYDRDGDMRHQHKDWLSLAYFEWKLERAMTIKDLLKAVNMFRRVDGTTTGGAEEFPWYCLRGASSIRKNVLNCATFSVLMLKVLGAIDRDHDVLNAYVPRTWWDFTGDVAKVGGVVIAAAAATAVTGGAAGVAAAALGASEVVVVGSALGVGLAGNVYTINVTESLGRTVTPQFAIRGLTNRYIRTIGAHSPKIIRTAGNDILKGIKVLGGLKGDIEKKIVDSENRVNYF